MSNRSTAEGTLGSSCLSPYRSAVVQRYYLRTRHCAVVGLMAALVACRKTHSSIGHDAHRLEFRIQPWHAEPVSINGASAILASVMMAPSNGTLS